MAESTKNYTTTPLASQHIYIGTWEKCLIPSTGLAATAVITLLADQNAQITAYQSLNRAIVEQTQYSTSAGVPFTYNVQLNQPYVYFTVRNTSNSAMTYLQFSVIYQPISIPNIAKYSATIWLNAVVGAGDVSSAYLDASQHANSVLSIFGHASAPTTVGMRVSNDGILWFYNQYTTTVPDDSDFGFAVSLPFKYVRLYSSAACTITAMACWS
jgi:hypothetical protein